MSDKLSRSEQSRINGGKSHGPTSPEGKAISSRNGLKHGFAATINNVLRVEDKEAFTTHLECLRTSWRPQDYFEQVLVDQLASISWRQARLVGLETALIDAQMSIQDENVETLHPFSGEDAYFKLVLAWQALARQPQKPIAAEPGEPMDPTIPPDGYDIGSIELARRYLTSLDRQFRNTLLNLRQYRQDLANTKPAQPAPAEAPQPTGLHEPEIVDQPTPQIIEKRPPVVELQPSATAQPATRYLFSAPKPVNKR